jgi:hypothetical protein
LNSNGQYDDQVTPLIPSWASTRLPLLCTRRTPIPFTTNPSAVDTVHGRPGFLTTTGAHHPGVPATTGFSTAGVDGHDDNGAVVTDGAAEHLP